MNNYFHINGIRYDAPRIMEEIINHPPEWKLKGLEFMIQMLDPSNAPVSFFTSGTTGTPKQMVFTKSQILYSAKNSCKFLGIDHNSKLYLCLPADKVAGRLMMVRALVSGAQLIWEEPVLHPLKNDGLVDMAAFTPAQVSAILASDASKKILEKIKTVIIGGGEISVTLENELKKLSNRIYATYGMTETLTHVAMRKIGEDEYHSVYEEAHFTVNQNHCLEIFLPFISKEKLITNDQVELLSPVSFRWKGRYDHVINSGGVKLHPEEMEKILIQAQILPSGGFYITSQPDEKFGESPVIVLLTEHTPADVAAFLTKVNGLLKKHEHVKAIHIFNKFEYTDSGKLKRTKIH